MLKLDTSKEHGVQTGCAIKGISCSNLTSQAKKSDDLTTHEQRNALLKALQSW